MNSALGSFAKPLGCLIAPFFTLLVACSDKPAGTPNAVPTASSSMEWLGDTLRSIGGWQLVPEARIDGYTHDLGPISWLTVSRSGMVAVAQDQSRQVLFFDANGGFSGGFGTDGEGPGEFRRLGRRAGWIADTLWVWDGQLFRATLVSPERQLGHVINLPALRQETSTRGALPVFRRPLSVLAMYSAGTALVTSVARHDDISNPAMDTPALLLTSSRGGVLKLLGWLLPDSGTGASQRGDGLQRSAVRVPHYPIPLHDVSPDGHRIGMALAFVDGGNAGTFLLNVLDANGDTVLSRYHPFHAEAIPDAEVRRMRGALDRIARRSQLAAEAVSRARFPAVYSPITQLLMGRDGSVWLRLHAPKTENRWLILDDRGAVLDTVALPGNVRLMFADLDGAWVIETDQWDVPSLVRYRIAKRPSERMNT